VPHDRLRGVTLLCDMCVGKDGNETTVCMKVLHTRT
jgi:hypothetical protein